MKVIRLQNKPKKAVLDYIASLYKRAKAGEINGIATVLAVGESGESVVAHQYMLAAGASRLVYEMNRVTSWADDEPQDQS